MNPTGGTNSKPKARRWTYKRRLFWVVALVLLVPAATPLSSAYSTDIEEHTVSTNQGDFGLPTSSVIGPWSLHVEGATIFNGSATSTFQINGTGISFGNWSTYLLGNLTNLTLTQNRTWSLQDANGTLA